MRRVMSFVFAAAIVCGPASGFAETVERVVEEDGWAALEVSQSGR